MAGPADAVNRSLSHQEYRRVPQLPRGESALVGTVTHAKIECRRCLVLEQVFQHEIQQDLSGRERAQALDESGLDVLVDTAEIVAHEERTGLAAGFEQVGSQHPPAGEVCQAL